MWIEILGLDWSIDFIDCLHWLYQIVLIFVLAIFWSTKKYCKRWDNFFILLRRPYKSQQFFFLMPQEICLKKKELNFISQICFFENVPKSWELSPFHGFSRLLLLSIFILHAWLRTCHCKSSGLILLHYKMLQSVATTCQQRLKRLQRNSFSW